MRLLLRVERPVWVTRTTVAWAWQCRHCPPPACWTAHHVRTWDQAMTEAEDHLTTDHPTHSTAHLEAA